MKRLLLSLVTIALQLSAAVLPQYCRMSGDTYSKLLHLKTIIHDNVPPHIIVQKRIAKGLSDLVFRSRNESSTGKQAVEIIEMPESKPLVCACGHAPMRNVIFSMSKRLPFTTETKMYFHYYRIYVRILHI